MSTTSSPSRLRPQAPSGPFRVMAGRAAFAVVVYVAMLAGPLAAADRAQSPSGSPLVALSEIDPTISQDIRYASTANFTGKRVPGYEAPACWLRPAVAAALAKVQADLVAASPPLSLRVFDCYRPRRSVRAFVDWVGQRDDGKTRGYYPSVRRDALIARGYIGAASAHSRGIAVDLTIVRLAPAGDGGALPLDGDKRGHATTPCTEAGPASNLAAGGIDMGTTFDCFDVKSHTAAGGLTPDQRQARATLKSAMERRGFRNYAREWWHFSYPAADDGRSFDVPINAGPSTMPDLTKKRR
ncbi:MAG: M15 family metallopeptidase [Hyphomicrobiaceae bacterium]|nr:M15 family metallopeptidase [Hyphomicrobiaceae bacterium]